MQVLKQNPYRSVLLDQSASPPSVLKRFHHPRFWQALRDGARARGEYRALQRCRELELPVPTPLCRGRDDAGPYLRMQAIEGAHSLESHLLGKTPVAPWATIMERLGWLLARMQNLGVRHPDLHPGNVLVDPQGHPYLVDLRGLRRQRSPLGTDQVLRDLVAAEADARDYLSTPLRRRFARAWLRAQRRSQDVDWELVQRLARRRRRDYVEHGAGRWLRRSSRCHREERPGAVIYRSKFEPGFLQEASQEAAPSLRVEGTRAEVELLWRNAARCVEHRLPVAWPSQLILQGARAEASFALASAPGLAWPGQGPAHKRALRALYADRGIAWDEESPEAWHRAAGGGYLLRPPAKLVALN